MGDPFKVEFRGDHVHVELEPGYKVGAETREKLWAALAAACKEHGTRRVLVEGYIPDGERPTSEVIDAGQKTGTVPNLWLALHFEGFVPNEQSELFVTIAASRGVRVKLFA